MRPLHVAVALAALATAGCLPDDHGAVLLHFESRSDGSSAPPSYTSSRAAAAFTPDGLVHLSATSNQGILQVTVDGPLALGATIDLPPGEPRVRYTIADSSWTSDGGTLSVLSIDPAIISFTSVPMHPSAGPATGSFVLTGGGTFR